MIMPDCSQKEQTYFIGANTKNGFVGFGDEIFKDTGKIYIIKGGPGTGKSTFMRNVCAEAQKRGYTVKKYLCSSDPSSLDAVVIDELSLAFTDGTSPHILEGRYIGACENYLDFGLFWNRDFLHECLDEIKEISLIKKESFSSLYRLIKAASVITDERSFMLDKCFDKEKSDKAAMRLLSPFGQGSGFSLHTHQISAFGMNGSQMLPTYETMANYKIGIADKRSLAPSVFNSIIKAAEVLKLKTYISYDIFLKPNALFFPEKALSVSVLGDDKIINTERFLLSEAYSKNRSKIRFLNSLTEDIISLCSYEWQKIKESHFALESIYSSSMDFDALNSFCSHIIEENII